MENIKFKDSGVAWIGMIPDDWKIVSIGDIANVFSGKGIKKDEYVDNGMYPIIGANGEIGRCNDFNNDHDVITTGRVGTLGTIHRVDKAWISDNTLIIDIKSKEVNINYLEQAMKCLPYSELRTGTAQPLMTATKIKECKIPLPPLDQQELIAGYLDEQSRKQSLLKHSDLITQLKNYKSSIISEYVTGKKSINNTAVTMKDSGIDWIGEIPSHWEVKKLSGLTEFINGYSFKSDEMLSCGEYPIVRITQITEKGLDLSNCVYANTIGKAAKAIIKSGDVLLAMSGATTGKTAIVYDIPDNTLANQRVGIIRASHINNKFLDSILKTTGFIEYVAEKAKGSAQPNISTESMNNFVIPVPPLSEQEAIAAKLDAVITEVDSVVTNSEKIVAELKAYKSAVITEFVTGQKLVPGFNSAERERVSSNIPWIGMIPSDWKVCKLGDIAKMKQPKTIAKKDMLDDGLYRVFGANGYIGYYNECNYKDDQVAVSCRGANSGVVNYIEGPVYITGNSMVCSIDHRKDIDKKFLLYSLIGMDMTRFVTGSAQPQITQENLSKAEVLLPILSEQQAIVNYLDSETAKIDTQINYYETLIKEMKSFRQAIISEAVTGKINN